MNQGERKTGWKPEKDMVVGVEAEAGAATV